MTFAAYVCGLACGLMLGVIVSLPISLRAVLDNLEASRWVYEEDGRQDIYMVLKLGPFEYRKELKQPVPK